MVTVTVMPRTSAPILVRKYSTLPKQRGRQTDRQTDRQTNNLTDSCSSKKVEKMLKLYKTKSTTITKIKSTKKCIIFPK